MSKLYQTNKWYFIVSCMHLKHVQCYDNEREIRNTTNDNVPESVKSVGLGL